MSATRLIDGPVLRADGTAWRRGKIKFRPLATTTLADATVPVSTVVAFIDDDGMFHETPSWPVGEASGIYLLADLSVQYAVILPDQSEHLITVPSGEGPVSLHTLITISGLPPLGPDNLSIMEGLINDHNAAVDSHSDIRADLQAVGDGLASEIETRGQETSLLTENLNNEIGVRAAADALLRTDLTAETNARTAADQSLTSAMASEIEARTAADQALADDLASETEARIAADADLAASIENISLTPGPKGDDGADGMAGADGLSAYGVAVANGFVGTESEWLTSLIGPQGEPGEPGLPGVDGADGADGTPGSKWYNGAGVPSNSVGIDGDRYLDDTTADVYVKASGTWSKETNIRGLQGVSGTNGQDAAAQGTYFTSIPTLAWVSGLTYRVGAASGFIGGTAFNSAEQQISAGTADSTFDRINALVLNPAGILSVISGTPSSSPAVPVVDAQSYIVVTTVLIKAGAVAASVTQTALYQEGTEWTPTAIGTTVNPASTTNPRSGTKAIQFTISPTGEGVKLVGASGISLANQNALVFYIRNDVAWSSKRTLSFQWYTAGAVAVGNAIALKSGVYGFNASTTGSYQQIVIPPADFAVPTSTSVQELRILVGGSQTGLSLTLDDVVLQAGISQTSAKPFNITTDAYRGTWSSTTSYDVGTLVVSSGMTYLALAASVNVTPTSAPTVWAPLGLTTAPLDSEGVQDQIGTHVKAGTGIVVTYDDASGDTTIASSVAAGMQNPMTAVGDLIVGGAASYTRESLLTKGATARTYPNDADASAILDTDATGTGSTGGGAGSTPTWVVDLGSAKEIIAFSWNFFFLFSSVPSQWRIDSSTDNVSWTTRHTGTGTGTTVGNTKQVATTALQATATARYWRFVTLASVDPSGGIGGNVNMLDFGLYTGLPVGYQTRLAKGANNTYFGVDGSGNVGYQDLGEAVQDQIGAHIKAGTGISVVYDDASGDTTITNTGGGTGGTSGMTNPMTAAGDLIVGASAAGAATNEAMAGTASMSGAAVNGHVASLINDGQDSTYALMNASVGSTYTIDLGSSKTINGYRVLQGSFNADSPSAWVLESSPDTTTWTPQDTVTGLAAGQLAVGPKTLTATTARYWRIRTTAMASASGWLVWTFDLFSNYTAGAPIRLAKGANNTYLGVDGSGNVGYQDFVEAAQDAIAPAFTGGTHSGISFVYDDANGKINANVPSGLAAPDVFPQIQMLWHGSAKVLAGAAMSYSVDSTQAGDRYYQNPFALGDSFAQTVLLKAGTYTFKVIGQTSSNRGIVDWYLDDQIMVAQQDWYGSDVSNVVKTATVTVGTSGRHVLKGVVSGKNASSSNYALTLTNYWFEAQSLTTELSQGTDIATVSTIQPLVRASFASNQALSGSYASNIINYSTVAEDTTSSVTTGAAWKFTAPLAGRYRVTSLINTNSTTVDKYLKVVKNGVSIDNFANATSAAVGGSYVIQANAGDTLAVELLVNNAATANSGWITIERLPDASVAAKNATIPVYPTYADFWHSEAAVVSGPALSTGFNASQPYLNLTSQASAPSNGDAWEHTFLAKAGTYTFSVLGAQNTDRAIVDWFIDGVRVVSGQDWYGANTLNITKMVTVTVPTTGRHVLKGVVNGKNASSTNYYVQLTKYWLSPSSRTTEIIPSDAGGIMMPFIHGLPAGTLQREYRFDDGTVQNWTSTGTVSNSSNRLTSTAPALEPNAVAAIADGEVIADVQMGAGSSETGLIVRATDVNNCYFFYLNNTDFYLFKRVSGVDTVLAQRTHGLGTSTRNVRAMLRFVGSNLEAYVNGTLVVRASDTTYTTGRIGLYFGGATSYYDNVKVYSLPSTWTAPESQNLGVTTIVPRSIGAKARHTVAQTLSTTVSKVTLGTSVRDTASMVDLANSRLVCRVGGTYLITGSIGLAYPSSPQRLIGYVYINGALSDTKTDLTVGSSMHPTQPVLHVATLNVGDYVELWGYATSNSASDPSYTWLAMEKIDGIAPPQPLIKTVRTTATDSHTADNATEDIAGMTLTFTTSSLCTVKVDFTTRAQVMNTTNWENVYYKIDLDNGTQVEDWIFSRDTQSASPTYKWLHSMHGVFENVAPGTHTVKMRWTDGSSMIDVNFYERRLTVQAIPQ